MKPNEIIDEIHRARAEHAEECGYDVDVMFARMREGLERLRTEGWEIVSLPPKRIEEPTPLLGGTAQGVSDALFFVRRMERIYTSAGYACPVICNPDELLPP